MHWPAIDSLFSPSIMEYSIIIDNLIVKEYLKTNSNFQEQWIYYRS